MNFSPTTQSEFFDQKLRRVNTKSQARQLLLDFLNEKNIHVVDENFAKPWGGYLVIDDNDLNLFINTFFPKKSELKNTNQKLRPKVLLVAPQSRLSWQYHFRRAEIWKVVFGPIAVMQNTTDEQVEPTTHQTDELIEHGTQVRHRLIGLNNWGVVAEIWQHTDSDNLSEEDDIVRVQDDYGR